MNLHLLIFMGWMDYLPFSGVNTFGTDYLLLAVSLFIHYFYPPFSDLGQQKVG